MKMRERREIGGCLDAQNWEDRKLGICRWVMSCNKIGEVGLNLEN